MKIKVMGDAVKLTSSLTQKDFDLLKKFNQEIVLTDEEDNELFRVDFKLGLAGGLNNYGIMYNSVHENGAVYVTIVRPGRKEAELVVMLREELALAINYVQEAEKLAQDILEEVKHSQELVDQAFED